MDKQGTIKYLYYIKRHGFMDLAKSPEGRERYPIVHRRRISLRFPVYTSHYGTDSLIVLYFYIEQVWCEIHKSLIFYDVESMVPVHEVRLTQESEVDDSTVMVFASQLGNVLRKYTEEEYVNLIVQCAAQGLE